MTQVQVRSTTENTRRAAPKLTAAQIEKDCPLRLRQIGKEITERLTKADRQTQLAQDHLTAIEQLLAEAKKLCDNGGYKKFHELFCPQLGKSQAYAMLAIAAGKKTLAEHRASNRARVAKHRAKKADLSVTVTDKSQPASSERPESRPEDAPADAPGIVPDQKPEAAAPRRGATPKDEALFDFTAVVLELVRRTRGHKVGRFAKTAVKADDLAKLGKFLTDLADLKKPSAESVGTSCMQ
jgi:hypothetical protein